MPTAYQRLMAETDPYKRGIALAVYQTEGLTARDADVVRRWRSGAMNAAKRARTERQRTRLNGFVRGCSDFLARVEDAR